MEAMWSARIEGRLGEIVTPMNMSEAMAARIPNAKLVIFEDAGHVPVITRGAHVAREIEAYFTARP
jgi:pimeloyl-ACP methyl ester carboxylesterase